MNKKCSRPQRSKTATRAKSLASAAIRPPIANRDAAPRLDIVDTARGVAIAMMIAYHFCFDLTYFGWTRWAMLDDPRWVAWRASIVASFLFLVGISLALREARDRARVPAMPHGRDANRAFIKRWAQVAAGALLVSIGSALLFPDTFIYFGVLHFVAVALWVCRRAPRLGGSAIALGLVAITLGTLIHEPAFDPRLINWIGFAEQKPITEDYVPLFPWLGVVLIGCGVGALWTRHKCRLAPFVSHAWQGTPRGLRKLLATSGRWSLTIYLVHQPILFSAMSLIKQLR
ncbi:MAG: heparan-alpha-glucosaminide N-acetyltransferase [Burkholderiaceae bacterium]